jgi:O-antigen ligase
MALVFSKFDSEESDLHEKLYYSFISGLFLACIICLANALYVYVSRDNDADSFFFYNLTNVIGFQPTYFAYYLIFAITYGLYVTYYQEGQQWIFLKCGGILFLFFILMLTGGQTAFISMLLIFAFFILKFLVEEKSSIKRIAISLITFMLLCMFLTAITAKEGSQALLSDAWDRLILWESAINAIPNLFFGVGTGDYKAVLNEYYLAHGLQQFANESYNSHNQFIQILFSNGILGVFAMILMIARPLYLASKRNNILAVLALFPFLIYGITEVFLGRYQGVVFFAFLHQFLIVQLSLKNRLLFVKAP